MSGCHVKQCITSLTHITRDVVRGGSRLISTAEKDLTTNSNDSEKQGHGVILGHSAGTIITKVTKKPNNRVLPGALLFG